MPMPADRQTHAMLAICTTILVAAALSLGRSIFAPFALALFMVAIVWPLQRALETRLPQVVALLLTLIVDPGRGRRRQFHGHLGAER